MKYKISVKLLLRYLNFLKKYENKVTKIKFITHLPNVKHAFQLQLTSEF